MAAAQGAPLPEVRSQPGEPSTLVPSGVRLVLRQAGEPCQPASSRSDTKSLHDRERVVQAAPASHESAGEACQRFLTQCLQQRVPEAIRRLVQDFTQADPCFASPAPAQAGLVDVADLAWVERLETLHLLQARLPRLSMTLEQRDAVAGCVQDAIDQMGRRLARPGAAGGQEPTDGKGKPSQDRPAALAAFLHAWPGGHLERAQARRTGRAAGLCLGGHSLSRQQREGCLNRWAVAMGRAPDEARQLSLTYFMQGFAWALAPRPPESPPLARDMVEALCRAPWTVAASSAEAATQQFIVGLRGICLGLGCGLMAADVLRTILASLHRPVDGLAATDARRWLGSDGLAQALFNVVDVMGGPRLPDDHLAVILASIERSPASARAKHELGARLVEALGGPAMYLSHRRMLLAAWTRTELGDAALRILLLHQLATAGSGHTDPEVRKASLVIDGAHLPPPALWRLVDGLFGPADAMGTRLPSDFEAAWRAIVPRAGGLPSQQRVLLACCLGVLGAVGSMPAAGLAALEASVTEVLAAARDGGTEAASGGHTTDILRGLRLAHAPVQVMRDGALPMPQRQALFEQAVRMPGLLTAASAPALFTELMLLPHPATRREMVSSLFLHGAQHLPLPVFRTARVLLTRELSHLLEGGPLHAAPIGAPADTGAAAASTSPLRRHRLPPQVQSSYLDGLSHLTALYEILSASRGLECLASEGPVRALTGERRTEADRVAGFLRAELAQLSSADAPATLLDAVRHIVRVQLAPLERALGVKPEVKGLPDG